MNTVPFHLSDRYQGLAYVQGIVRDERDHLSLEYQTQDSLLGVIKSGVRELSIPLADLTAVTFERGWFGLTNRLVIQTSRLDTLDGLPGVTGGRVILSIARRDRAAAERFVDGLHVPARL